MYQFLSLFTINDKRGKTFPHFRKLPFSTEGPASRTSLSNLRSVGTHRCQVLGRDTTASSAIEFILGTTAVMLQRGIALVAVVA